MLKEIVDRRNNMTDIGRIVWKGETFEIESSQQIENIEDSQPKRTSR